jgi:hypothetical protein
MHLKYGLFIVYACVFCVPRPAAQDLNGFRIGMSKAEICKLVSGNAIYILAPPATCPEIEDYPTIETTKPTLPNVRRVNLMLRNGVVAAIWATFPSVAFNAVDAMLTVKFGSSDSEQVTKAGKSGGFANSLVHRRFWRVHIYVEQFNHEENGEMVGWLAFVPLRSFEQFP